MEKRLLTPAEAVLLLAPTSSSAGTCVQAALLSLLDAGRIAVEPASGPLKRPALVLTRPTAPPGAPLPAHLVAVEEALSGYGKGPRLIAAQVLHALQGRFGHGFGRYVHDELAPSLIRRGLLTRLDDKWLGLFPRIRYQRTPNGDALAAPLERLVAALARVPSLVKTDPDQALRLARSAGVLLVLSPASRRQIPRLRKMLAERGDDVGSVSIVPFESDDEPAWGQLIELGDMALAFDLGDLFDGVDAVGDLTGGGDSSSSDGGDGGGGGD